MDDCHQYFLLNNNIRRLKRPHPNSHACKTNDGTERNLVASSLTIQVSSQSNPLLSPFPKPSIFVLATKILLQDPPQSHTQSLPSHHAPPTLRAPHLTHPQSNPPLLPRAVRKVRPRLDHPFIPHLPIIRSAEDRNGESGRVGDV